MLDMSKTVAGSHYSGIVTVDDPISEDRAIPSFFRGNATVTQTFTFTASRNDIFAIVEVRFNGINYTYINEGGVLHGYVFGNFYNRVPMASGFTGVPTNATTAANTLVAIGARLSRVGRTVTVTVTYSGGGVNCTVPAHTINVRGRFFRLPF